MAARSVRPVDRPIDARVPVPGSKSIANRALVCAALADGTSSLERLPDGDDTVAMIECLDRLGIGSTRLEGRDARRRVDGTGGRLRAGPLTLPTRLAGTTSRFVTAMVALGAGPYVVDGLPPLRARPMAALHDALIDLGVSVVALDERGHLPVEISGPPRPTDRALDLPGDVSSQYVSALMMIGPLLPGGLRIALSTPLVSRPYVELTAAVMAAFGCTDVIVDERSVTVGPGRYVPCEYEIEPDASSASYPFAAVAICGGRVTVPGLHRDALQGDVAIVELLARMGCAVTDGADGLEVTGSGALVGIDVDMADISDLVPTIAAVAAFASTPTRIRGVGFIRGKESDRIGDLCDELRRAGIDAIEHDDGISVGPGIPHPARLAVHHDHRLAMAFGLVGLKVAGIEIDDPWVVAKSWPGFWSMLEGL